MPAFVEQVISAARVVTVSFITDFVSDYWATILSVLGVLLVVGIFRKLVKGSLRA